MTVLIPVKLEGAFQSRQTVCIFPSSEWMKFRHKGIYDYRNDHKQKVVESENWDRVYQRFGHMKSFCHVTSRYASFKHPYRHVPFVHFHMPSNKQVSNHVSWPKIVKLLYVQQKKFIWFFDPFTYWRVDLSLTIYGKIKQVSLLKARSRMNDMSVLPSVRL